MKLLSLVVALLVVAFLLYKQLDSGKSEATNPAVEGAIGDNVAPKRPEDVKDLQKKLNDTVLKQADDTARRINDSVE